MFSLATLLALFSGGGVIAYALLAVFAPSILAIIQPIVVNLINGISDLISRTWKGLAYIFGDFNGVVCLVSLMLASSLYTNHYVKKNVEKKLMNELRKEYKFVPKKKPAPQFKLDWWRQ